MTAEPAWGELTQQRVLAELTGMLLDVTGEDELWAAGVTPASRLEGDLGLESVEFAALAGLVKESYGHGVDLAALLAGLDIDQIIALTVGDLAAYVAARRHIVSPAGIDG